MNGKRLAVILLVVLGLIVFSVYGSYNRLVALDEKANQKWSDLGSLLQRRMDLIPNLVETVKGYAAHEKEVLKNVSDARAKLAGAKTLEAQVAGENELSGALARLLVVVENYPQLRADANFRQLQDELAGTENRITIGRKDYNQAVQKYNQTIRSFPMVIYAKAFGFEAKPYFEAQKGAAEAPKVNF